MALPEKLTLIPVHGRFMDVVRTPRTFDTAQSTGLPATGYVQFEMRQVLTDTADHTLLLPGTFIARLDKNGEFLIQLPATDDPDISPLGWKYLVKVRLSSWRTQFQCAVPVSTAGTLEFDDLVPERVPSPVAVARGTG